MNLKRMPNPSEVVALIEYIYLLKVYITDDHSEEMSDENPLDVIQAEQLLEDLVT